MAIKNRNKRIARPRPNPPVAVYTGEHEPCEQCRLSGRRVRFSITLNEAKQIVDALGDTELAAYFQAHLTIASRPDSYQYDC